MPACPIHPTLFGSAGTPPSPRNRDAPRVESVPRARMRTGVPMASFSSYWDSSRMARQFTPGKTEPARDRGPGGTIEGGALWAFVHRPVNRPCGTLGPFMARLPGRDLLGHYPLCLRHRAPTRSCICDSAPGAPLDHRREKGATMRRRVHPVNIVAVAVDARRRAIIHDDRLVCDCRPAIHGAS